MTEAKSPREMLERLQEYVSRADSVGRYGLADIYREIAAFIEEQASYAAERERLLLSAEFALEGLADATFVGGLTAINTDAWMRARKALNRIHRLSSRPAAEGKDFT